MQEQPVQPVLVQEGAALPTAPNAWVVQNMQNTIVDGSKDTYLSKIVGFLRYCEEKCPAMLCPSFLTDAVRDSTGAVARKYVKFALYTSFPPKPILDHSKFETRIVHDWMSTLKGKKSKKQDGPNMASNSSYNGARSAVRQLFTRYSKPLPSDYERDTAGLLAGVKRTIAKAKQDGDVSMVEGKAAMSFLLYCMIAKEFLRNGDVFSHLFLLCSWNLMCRASNTDGIRLQHLEWQDDCLKIYFGLQKNDQDGTRNMDPRHCYANPFNPEISIVLSLGIYFLCFGVNKNRNARLFEGKNQYQRFLKALKKVMASCPEIKAEMERCGLTCEDIAAHSTRKGGRSYCAGGSTNGPAFVTIMLRGGWSLEGIDKRYVRYERAGDQYVGRILSGLNVNSVEFAFLPPFFSNADSEINVVVSDCFPDAPVEMELILRFCLASVVHHQDYLRRELSAKHPLFSTTLFAGGLAKELQPKVECRLSRAGDRLVPTGIPSHVLIMGRMEMLEKQMIGLPQAVTSSLKSYFDGRDHGKLFFSCLED
jgi:hypothetical protein